MRIAELRTKRRRTEDAGWCGVLVICLLLLICLPPAQAQRTGSMGSNPMPMPGQVGIDSMGQPLTASPGPLDRKMRATQLKAFNTQRQRSLVSDTDRLVKLAAELNAQINNSHQARLTPGQLRTVAEIEKLARRVRENMSDAGGAAPAASQPLVLMLPGMALP